MSWAPPASSNESSSSNQHTPQPSEQAHQQQAQESSVEPTSSSSLITESDSTESPSMIAAIDPLSQSTWCSHHSNVFENTNIPIAVPSISAALGLIFHGSAPKPDFPSGGSSAAGTSAVAHPTQPLNLGAGTSAHEASLVGISGTSGPSTSIHESGSDTNQNAEFEETFHVTDMEPKATRRKRTRTLTTAHQSAALLALLAKTPFPTTAEREEVGRQVGLTGRKVQIWFQNQRQKQKKVTRSGSVSQTVFSPTRSSPLPLHQQPGFSAVHAARMGVEIPETVSSPDPPLQQQQQQEQDVFTHSPLGPLAQPPTGYSSVAYNMQSSTAPILQNHPYSPPLQSPSFYLSDSYPRAPSTPASTASRPITSQSQQSFTGSHSSLEERSADGSDDSSVTHSPFHIRESASHQHIAVEPGLSDPASSIHSPASLPRLSPQMWRPAPVVVPNRSAPTMGPPYAVGPSHLSQPTPVPIHDTRLGLLDQHRSATMTTTHHHANIDNTENYQQNVPTGLASPPYQAVYTNSPEFTRHAPSEPIVSMPYVPQHTRYRNYANDFPAADTAQGQFTHPAPSAPIARRSSVPHLIRHPAAAASPGRRGHGNTSTYPGVLQPIGPVRRHRNNTIDFVDRASAVTFGEQQLQRQQHHPYPGGVSEEGRPRTSRGRITSPPTSFPAPPPLLPSSYAGHQTATTITTTALPGSSPYVLTDASTTPTQTTPSVISPTVSDPQQQQQLYGPTQDSYSHQQHYHHHPPHHHHHHPPH